MKKVLAIVFVLISFTAFGQDTPYVKPVTPTSMAANYWFKQQVWIDSVLKARKAIFKDSVGFQGVTTVPTIPFSDSSRRAVNSEYMKKFIRDSITPGVPGTETSAWQYTGNYGVTGNRGRLGFKDSSEIQVITNNLVRLIVPDDGVKRSSGAANRVLMIDTVTKKLYYADMATGGGGSGSTEYILQGYGLKVDSSGRVYTVGVDTALIKTVADAQGDSIAHADAINLRLLKTDTSGKWVGNIQINGAGDSLVYFIGASRTAVSLADVGNGKYIPLSGTEAGKPVTGYIEYSLGPSGEKIFDSEYGDYRYQMYFIDPTYGLAVLKGYKQDDENFSGMFIDGQTRFRGQLSGVGYELDINSNKVTYNSFDSGSRGFGSEFDFTPNITDLDYAQKKYVGFRGTATLVAGSVTVATDKILTGYKIYLSVNEPGGTQGFLSAPTSSIIDATSFIINSTSNTETSTVNWWIAP